MFKLSLFVLVVVIQSVYCQSPVTTYSSAQYGYQGSQLFNEIQSLQSKLSTYHALLKELKLTKGLKSQQIASLGYRLALYDAENPGVCDVKKMIEEQPELIKTFPWNENVSFKNILYPKYISYSDELTNGNRFARAKDGTSTGLWRIETSNNGYSFRIKNVNTNEFLYASSDKDARDPKRRNVFTTTDTSKYPVDADQWNFELTADGKRFKVINLKYREGLYVSDYIVLTWREGECEGNECLFDIKAE